MVSKNQEYVVDIIDNGLDGQGIAKINDFTIFVPQALKGEKVKILIVKVQSSYAFAKILEIIKKSKYRVIENCETYKRCGGCSLRFVDYNETLNMKKEIVKNCLRKELKREIDVYPTIGMGNPYYYRNKLQYPVGINKYGKPIMGVYANRSHDIIPTKECAIQNKLTQNIVNDSFEYLINNGIEPYDEKNQTGILRHIVARIGIVTNEVMLILVINKDDIKDIKAFINYIIAKYPELKTIVINKNKRNTNVILGQENEVIYGEGYIYDVLGEYMFKISPLSFYQVNPTQTEILYYTAIDYAELTGEEIVLDLYCGIGTIGIFASKHAKKVYGIEIVENAIKDAKENAKLNSIDNAEFFAGDVEYILPKIIEKERLSPDVIFIDPPRKGCDGKTLENLLNFEPKKVVYVSCNPATLARDIRLLEKKYELLKVQPVDMFPYTSHVECVTILELKNSEKTLIMN